MTEENSSKLYIPNSRQTTIATLVIGLFVGLIGWVLNIALQLWIITPLFCQNPQTYNVCGNGGTISWVAAMLLVSVIGLLGLVRAGVFRPLLVVLASLIALWGVSAWLGPLVWWQSLLWHGVLFAIGFGLFAWVAKLRSFIAALVIIIVIIIGIRLVVINS